MVKEYLNGNFNENKTSALILKANLLEEKIMTNNLQDQNTDVDKILELQSEITAITIFLRNSLKINKISDKNKNKAKHFFDNKKQMKEDLVKETGCKLEDIKVIATGGLNSMLSPITDAFDCVDKDFTLCAMKRIADLIG